MRLRYLRTALRRSLTQLWSSRIGASLSMNKTGQSVANWDMGVKRRGGLFIVISKSSLYLKRRATAVRCETNWVVAVCGFADRGTRNPADPKVSHTQPP